MKKNRMMRLASILLVCVLLTTSVISGTFAKYTTSYTGTDSARVAKFDVSAFGAKVTGSAVQTVTVDLFKESYIYDTKGTDFTSGANDEDILDNTAAIIAPGSWGTFDFQIKNDSEVNVEYTVTYTVDEDSVPLKWSIDGGTTWTEDLASVSATKLGMTAADNAATVNVLWKWDFEGDNDADTAKGIDYSNYTPSVTINITITQVD